MCLFVDTRKETRLELSISKSVDTIIIRPVSPVADPWGDGSDRSRKRARKTFLNVSENKSSDRKPSLIPFV